MRELSSVIRYCFENSLSNYTNGSSILENDKFADMIIPINSNSFEVPIFALEAFSVMHLRGTVESTDAIVVNLCKGTGTSTYKSLACRVRDILQKGYSANQLTLLTEGSDPNPYYGTGGAIFNKDFQPVMLLTWQMQKVFDIEEENSRYLFRYRFTKPILRVAPEVFILKADSVQRFIINKIVPKLLNLSYVYKPDMRACSELFLRNDYTRLVPKVEIEKCPFEVKEADAPSISTTNEKLLDVALNNLEEIIQ